MQLYAVDKHKQTIGARQAERQTDYFCLECGAKVRLRGGIHRQSHFFHLFTVEQCRQNGKSLVHLQVQRRLEELLGFDQCRLEVKFEPINRIADVVWEAKKIIFEVQCSPISAAEVLSRNRDYKSVGYDVIWLLHDNQFNRHRVSAAEIGLRDHSHYFTNMGADGIGYFYDQFDVISRGLRKVKLPPLQVDPSKPIHFHGSSNLTLQLVRQRLGNCSTFFAGDLVDLCVRYPVAAYIQEALSLESSSSTSRFSWRKLWKTIAVDPYTACLHALLEKLSS